MKMSLWFRNTLMIVLASSTLAGGLFRPPYVEPAQAAAVPSVQILRSANQPISPDTQRQHFALQEISEPAAAAIEHNQQLYVPIRSYVETHHGKLIYNPETTSVDVTLNQVSFSLLLAEAAILSDGRLTEGGFLLLNNTAYLSLETFSALMSTNNRNSQA
ncbi:hypothetical protein ACX1C1_02025 [Paenibacillus sp. strain BS8-2]